MVETGAAVNAEWSQEDLSPLGPNGTLTS